MLRLFSAAAPELQNRNVEHKPTHGASMVRIIYRLTWDITSLIDSVHCRHCESPSEQATVGLGSLMEAQTAEWSVAVMTAADPASPAAAETSATAAVLSSYSSVSWWGGLWLIYWAIQCYVLIMFTVLNQRTSTSTDRLVDELFLDTRLLLEVLCLSLVSYWQFKKRCLCFDQHLS